jgi:hypothetical protein
MDHITERGKISILQHEYALGDLGILYHARSISIGWRSEITSKQGKSPNESKDMKHSTTTRSFPVMSWKAE